MIASTCASVRAFIPGIVNNNFSRKVKNKSKIHKRVGTREEQRTDTEWTRINDSSSI